MAELGRSRTDRSSTFRGAGAASPPLRCFAWSRSLRCVLFNSQLVSGAVGAIIRSGPRGPLFARDGRQNGAGISQDVGAVAVLGHGTNHVLNRRALMVLKPIELRDKVDCRR